MARKSKSHQNHSPGDVTSNLELHKYKLTAKTPNQKTYIQGIDENRVIFCRGPAGTGKSHIATARGILGLHKGEWDKIIITRPVVQAGENLGFLPGDINSKLDPYVRPILDELAAYVSIYSIRSLIHIDNIEILPFAFMRGRNFHNCYIIADECQNSSFKQLEMVLTRVGCNSKLVLTGDSSQSDLPSHQQGGFDHWIDIIKDVDDIHVANLYTDDIVRDPIVEAVLLAKEKYESEETDDKSD